MNFLEEAGHLTPAKRRKVKSSNLKRLIGTPEVRDKLGIDLEDGRLVIRGEPKRVAKALMHVVSDAETIKVKDIYTQKQRIAYANNLPAGIVVPRAKNAGAGSSSRSPASASRSAQRSSAPRDCLIPSPSRCVLNVTDERCNNIAGELRRMSLIRHTNAVSVLFRVFIELSADAYAAKNHLSGFSVDAKLSKKLLDVSTDLVSRQKLIQQQVAPVRLSCDKNSFLAPSTALMNEYVHNKHIFPAPTDLRAYWDSLQPFIAAIWAP